MDLPSHLVPVFWSAVGVLGISALIIFACLNMLADAHRPKALRVIWISGGLFVASAIIVIMLLVQTR